MGLINEKWPLLYAFDGSRSGLDGKWIGKSYHHAERQHEDYALPTSCLLPIILARISTDTNTGVLYIGLLSHRSQWEFIRIRRKKKSQVTAHNDLRMQTINLGQNHRCLIFKRRPSFLQYSASLNTGLASWLAHGSYATKRG